LCVLKPAREIHPSGPAASNRVKQAAPLQRCGSVLSAAATNAFEDEDDDEYENEGLPAGSTSLFNQIAERGLKQILDWEKALGQSSNRTLKR